LAKRVATLIAEQMFKRHWRGITGAIAVGAIIPFWFVDSYAVRLVGISLIAAAFLTSNYYLACQERRLSRERDGSRTSQRQA
jgi:hypothetical protein